MPLPWSALGVPPARLPISVSTLVSYILPPIVCGFAVAVLAVIPKTHAARVVLWPVVALMALRAVVSVDVSLGKPEGRMAQAFFVMIMFDTTINTLMWTFSKEPLVRHLRPANSTPSIIMDALDLSTNMRGHGWNWSRGLYIPQETRPKKRAPFVFYTLLSAIVHISAYLVLYQATLSFTRVGSNAQAQGLVVFDEAISFFARHLRASMLTALMGIMSYAYMQTNYSLATVLAILFLRQDPAQWPPAFDAPWCATSLTDFWGRRWHQWYRHKFLFLGGHPLAVFFGRVGIVLGAFLVSAVIHDVFLLGVDSRADARNMLLAFGMMGPGMLAERAFYRLTGTKVGGVVGWVWTMGWLLSWFSLMLDGFAKAGVFLDMGPLDGVGPLREWMERAVIGFDAWLHTI